MSSEEEGGEGDGSSSGAGGGGGGGSRQKEVDVSRGDLSFGSELLSPPMAKKSEGQLAAEDAIRAMSMSLLRADERAKHYSSSGEGGEGDGRSGKGDSDIDAYDDNDGEIDDGLGLDNHHHVKRMRSPGLDSVPSNVSSSEMSDIEGSRFGELRSSDEENEGMDLDDGKRSNMLGVAFNPDVFFAPYSRSLTTSCITPAC
jgi:hypothetical protein